MFLCGKKKKNKDGRPPFKPVPYKRPKINLSRIHWTDMQKVPEDLDELIDVPVYINMEKKVIVDEMITVADIKEQAYKEIYIGDEETAIQSINAL